MPFRRSVVALLLALLSSAGCRNKAEQPADADSSPVTMNAAAVRERYLRVNPQNRVGIVVAVRAKSHLAAVGEIPLQDFGIGDILVFIDGRERPFNSGEIVNATADALHVRYDENRRAPRAGELAVRVAPMSAAESR